MSTKYTPGPWTHLGMGDIHGHESNGGGVDIAVVYLREDDEKWMSNARLIAAAPDLLEALRMWMDIHETPAGFEGKCGKALDAAISAQRLRIDAAANAARAAIAKSTGEPQ